MKSHTNHELKITQAEIEAAAKWAERLDSPGEASLMSTRQAAWWLASFNFPVFPCCPRSKQPLRGYGHRNATTDVKAVMRIWNEVPDANIGIACGPGDLVVLDVDDHTGGCETLLKLEAELGPLPQTVEVRTGSCTPSMHFYFRALEEVEFLGQVGPGIDIRHDGYVVSAPSVHPDGGRYEWLTSPFQMEPAELPPEWLERMVKRPRGGTDFLGEKSA